jgi:hypothetical protein
MFWYCDIDALVRAEASLDNSASGKIYFNLSPDFSNAILCSVAELASQRAIQLMPFLYRL